MINYLKDKNYWYKTNKKLKIFLKKEQSDKILMFGYPKSGNTWLRFLLYNYHNLLLNPQETKTISYDRLNKLQNNVMDRGTTFSSERGFPLFYRTHTIYKTPYNLFNKKIFIHRNPLDTLISSYYFYKNRSISFSDDPIELRDKLRNIDFYVKFKIDSWINFYNTSIKHADIAINYSDMKMDAETELTKLIHFLNWEKDVNVISKSVQYSSFNKIKEMGDKKGQKYGNGPIDGSFKGEFTRSGEEGQFHDELSEKTINFVLNKFPQFHNLYPNLIE